MGLFIPRLVTSQPQGPADPLLSGIGNGLSGVWIPYTVAAPVNLVSGRPPAAIATAASASAGKAGSAFVTTSSGSAGYAYDNELLYPTDAVSVLALFETTGTTSNNHRIAGSIHPTVSPFKGFGLDFSSSTNVRWNVSGSTFSSINGAYVGNLSLVVGTYDRANMRLFVNGSQVASTAKTEAIQYNGTSFGLFRFTTALTTFHTAQGFAGKTYLVGVWRRALSLGEIQSLTSNPWQIFRPYTARIYSFPSAAGPNEGSGTIDGAGTLPGQGYRLSYGSGSCSATGTLPGEGRASHYGSGECSATGTLPGEGEAPAVGANEGSGVITDMGTLPGTGYALHYGSGTCEAVGTLPGEGEAPGAAEGSGQITGTGTLPGEGYAFHSGSGTCSAAGSLPGQGDNGEEARPLGLSPWINLPQESREERDARVRAQRERMGIIAAVVEAAPADEPQPRKRITRKPQVRPPIAPESVRSENGTRAVLQLAEARARRDAELKVMAALEAMEAERLAIVRELEIRRRVALILIAAEA